MAHQLLKLLELSQPEVVTNEMGHPVERLFAAWFGEPCEFKGCPLTFMLPLGILLALALGSNAGCSADIVSNSSPRLTPYIIFVSDRDRGKTALVYDVGISPS